MERYTIQFWALGSTSYFDKLYQPDYYVGCAQTYFLQIILVFAWYSIMNNLWVQTSYTQIFSHSYKYRVAKEEGLVQPFSQHTQIGVECLRFSGK